MHYRNQGYPEENELVLCTVTSVQYNSVFCTLDMYGRSGMIHISEIAPGRIRNIRDYVVEGKKVVCKVLRINEEKGHIDLSLRRVNESQRRQFNMLIKQEQKAEKIIENLAAELEQDPQKVYAAIAAPVRERYEYVHMAFQEHVEGEADLAAIVPKEYAAALVERVVEKIKPKSVAIGGTLALRTYDPAGVEVVREALEAAEQAGKGQLSIRYLGSGKYKVLVTADEYQQAEELLDAALAAARGRVMATEGGVADFARS